jgi:hypothetical protein
MGRERGLGDRDCRLYAKSLVQLNILPQQNKIEILSGPSTVPVKYIYVVRYTIQYTVRYGGTQSRINLMRFRLWVGKKSDSGSNFPDILKILKKEKKMF